MNSSDILNMSDTQDFMGAEGFVWFYGVVEDRKDPLFLGRVKVRCIGFHTDDKTLIPTEDLPWADIIQSITSAAISGIGSTPTGLVEGTHVFGFFRDGREAQEPVILGTSGGIPENFSNPNRGFNDSRSIEERKNAPYPPLYVDRFNSGIPAKVIEHSQYFEPTTYEFSGETPLKGGKLWFGKNKDESKIQANVYKKPETELPDTEPVKANNAPMLVSQLYSRNPDENRMIFDGNGLPIMSLPSTTLLALNRIKFIRKYEAEVTPTPHSSVHPQSQIVMKAHRISASLSATQGNLHKGIKKAVGDEWGIPPDGFNPEYPYNHVTYTESGHLFELDDSPGAERIRLLHRTQSFLEFLPDGSRVDNVVGKSYFLCDADVHSHVYGDEVKHVRGAMNHVYNSSSAGNSKTLFDGAGNVGLEIKKGNYNIDLKDGDMIISARNLIVKGTAKDPGTSTMQLQKMAAELGDSNKAMKAIAESYAVDCGDMELVCTNFGPAIAGNSKTNIGGICETTVGGYSSEIVTSAYGTGMLKKCTMGPITLEATSPGMPIQLHSGPGGSSSSLELSVSGMDLNTKSGNIKAVAKLGSVALTAEKSNFAVEAGTEIELKNKKSSIKMDDAGLVSITGGKGSDVHTLLKKLALTLKNLKFSTPAGPTTSIINLQEITGFDDEIDKVFKK